MTELKGKYMNTMTGTTGSTYNVVFETQNATVGTRALSGQLTRIRVEPKGNQVFEFWGDFKTPSDGNNRYSTVVANESVTTELLEIFEVLLNTADTKTDSDKFFGPGGTEYTLVFQNDNGRVGLAVLGEGSFRVRVEPSDDVDFDLHLNESTWKQPTDDNNRYSTVVTANGVAAAVAEAINALV